MANIKEDISTKPTLSKPVGALGKGYENNFKKTMQQNHVNLNETDGLLTEREQSLKKKIFSLAKMEALVFSDPKLSTVYDEMSENGEEKYGYHYNETIMNMLFNDYVLNSPKYLQKYKMAIPQKKKRRDKSGINQLKKAGDISMHKKPVNPIQTTPAVAETTGAASSGAFAGPAAWQKGGDLMETEKVEETTSSSSSGAYAGPAAWGGGDLLKGGKSKAMRKPIWQGGTIIQESNYLTDPSAFAKYVDFLNEDIDLSYQKKLGAEYEQSHNATNKGLGVSELPQTPERDELKTDIDKNTELYVGQDVDRMSTPNIKILHNDMTEPNSMFPHPKNPNLQDDGVLNSRYGGQVNKNIDNKYPNRAVADNIIIDKTAAFTSDVIKNWSDADTKLELNTLKNGTPDKANVNMMETQAGQPFNLDLNTVNETAGDDLIEFDVPDWAMSTLINGDSSGLEGDDEMKIDSFVKKAVQQFGNANFMLGDVDGKDDLGFRPSNDIDNLGSNVYRVYLRPSNSVDSETTASDRMYNSDAWVQAQRDAEGLDEEGGEWEAKQDLQQLQRDGAESVLNANKYIPILKKLVSTSKSKDDLVRIVGQYLREKGITDSDLYQSVIDKAIQMSQGTGSQIGETMQSIIDDKPDTVAKGTPTGTVSTGNVPVGLVDMKEEMDLLNEIDNELSAYSIHQKKLQQMSEDRKPSSLVLKDRLGAENATNFKKDFANSDTKDVINIEKELQWKDQQTDVPADPYKLGEDIEKTEIKSTDAKSGEALKNVGNSTNDKGDEIPKRNMTTAEQDEVNIYRKGMHSLNYDNKPDQRFEDRMKADMGDAVFEIREKQMAEFGKAPMYNKEAQPTQATKAVRTEFDKEKSGWNDPQGLKEAMISGRYRNALNKSHIIDFALNEVKFLRQTSEKTLEVLFPLDFTGLGNSFNAKTVDYKVSVNEGVIKALDAHRFYTDGKQVFAVKSPKQNLSEADTKTKPVLNEEMEKMKHLLGYKPNNFVSTDKTKKNRGF